ncbi:hypothetical protein PSTG_08940 [Puccinia striiformis f. sp. tritici PST-78]|uniref:Uncharacterized protein n=1 Tax=Puccinia striiformis f. sp. tritici PST-78 TaxID=1165861 RepID=A0A0L0VFC6_9BASI|nr:hypothetical protein PSTG_08940 [Puccinia striiformis f. sp. tritici PST-78]
MANSQQDPRIVRGNPSGPVIQPTITQEEAALQELMDLITDTMAMEGVNTQEEFGKFKMHFEEITDLLYSRGLSSHLNQFTRCFWNCLSPRSYSRKDNPHEVPSRVSINLENQLPDQSSPLDEPGGEEIKDNISQNSSEEKSILQPVTVAQFSSIHSEDILHGRIGKSKDPSLDFNYPEYQSQSDSNFQPGLLKKLKGEKSDNILDTNFTMPTPAIIEYKELNSPLIHLQAIKHSSLHIEPPLNQSNKQAENRTFDQPAIQSSAPNFMVNSSRKPCSDNDSMTVDQFLKGSHNCQISTINKISISRPEKQDSSEEIADQTYLGRARGKEYAEIEEKIDQTHTQLSPSLEPFRLSISGQNDQLLEESMPMMVSGNISHNIVTRNVRADGAIS